METQNISKNGIDLLSSNLNRGEIILYLLPAIAPIVYCLMNKAVELMGDIMDHGYDLNLKVGPVDLALTRAIKE